MLPIDIEVTVAKHAKRHTVSMETAANAVLAKMGERVTEGLLSAIMRNAEAYARRKAGKAGFASRRPR